MSFISPRLQAVLECIEKCNVLADIGTDHAYLPIEAVKKNFCERAIACDINKGPLETAKKNILNAGLYEKIETRLGNGLEPISVNEADCITITGMGGMLIKDILQNAQHKIKKSKIILSPQHDLEELRRFLYLNKYKIKEKLVRDRERFYNVLIAHVTNEEQPWTDTEFFLGKIESPDIDLYYLMLHKKISGYIHFITDEGTRQRAEKQLKWLEEGIKKHGNNGLDN